MRTQPHDPLAAALKGGRSAPKTGKKTGTKTGKPGQIYLIVNFVHGRSTRAFVFQPGNTGTE